MRADRPPAPPRPLLLLGALCAAASVLGASAGWLAWGALLGLVALARRGWLPAWGVLVFGLALCGARAEAPVAAPEGAATGRSEVGREGRLELSGTERGRLAPGGEPALVLELDGARANAGELVRVPAGCELRALARGPAPAPGGRGEPRARVHPDELERLASTRPPVLAALLARWEELRDQLRTRARAIEPRALPGLARALVVGEKEDLDRDHIALFTRTGTRHLLALSGLHVGLFAGLALAPLGALVAALARACGASRRRARLAGFLPRLGCLLLFVPLAGGSAPLVRAGLALGLGLAAPLARARGSAGPRRADSLSLWGAALALECLLDPGAARRLVVQLSYLATLGILLAAGPIATHLEARLYGEAPELGLGSWRELSRSMRLRARRAFCLAVGASVAALLGTLPVTWSYFGEIAPLGILATPLALLPLSASLLGAWAACLAPELAPRWPLELGALSMSELLRFFDALPGTPTPLPPRPAALLWLASACLLAGACARRGAARFLRVGQLVLGLLLLPWVAAPRGLELHMLDVGHGTAAVLRAPGLPALIYDAGSRDRSGVAGAALLPLLRQLEVSRPWVVLSHLDHDHAGALGALIERFPPARWIGELPSELRGRLPTDVLPERPGVGRHAILETPDLLIEVARGQLAEGNEGSASLRAEVAGRTLVLSGDAEGPGLAALLEQGFLDGPLELLSLPHHGSDTPHLGELLARSRPERVWVSAGLEPQLAAELDRRGLAWSWTARDGPLRLTP